MVNLSDRLSKIAGFIHKGERTADIGTDHGYIPIYLKQNGISDYIIAGDINQGPLEKMEENLEKHLGDDRIGIFMRLGSGFHVFETGEVDTVVIAGMGGLLMIDILKEDWEKTVSCKKFILQPRNAQDKLRKWLIDSGFRITGEVLAEESRFVWEIIQAEPPDINLQSASEDSAEEYFGRNPHQYEVGQLLINGHDPLLTQFICRKLQIERNIAENASKSDCKEAAQKKQITLDKIKMLEEILDNVNNQE